MAVASSRRLNLLVHEALGCTTPAAAGALAWPSMSAWPRRRTVGPIPRGRLYTGSVAAALAPVPKGSWWETASDGEGYGARVWHGDHVGTGSGRTVPLAILAAALRALAASIATADGGSASSH
jgi:hypothetical protein